MMKAVHLHGGPKDGEMTFVAAADDTVSFAEYAPPGLLSAPDPRPVPIHRYRWQGRRTLQGVEVFEHQP